jgi:ABC-type spermidine/putrescine transport system permease subunit II
MSSLWTSLDIAAWSTTLCAIFGGVIALPYALYRLARKDKRPVDLSQN